MVILNDFRYLHIPIANLLHIMPQVSILVPVYGVERYIERCARSLFEQTYSDIEYVFVDDCSMDQSITILEKVVEDYPLRKCKVKIIRHKENKGLSAARNTALEVSTGKYVMHVDSDDYIELNTVQLAVELAEREHADMVIFDMNSIYSDKAVTSSAKYSSDKMSYLRNVICRDSSTCIWGGIYTRNLYMKYGIRAIEGLNYGEDYVTKPRLIYYAHKIVYIPIPLYNYVQYNTNSYTNCVNSKSIQDVLKAVNFLNDFFRDVDKTGLFYESISVDLKIRNKIFLLEYCSKKDRTYVNGLFQEENNRNIKMPLKHKIVWELSRHGLLGLLNVYISTGQYLKRKFKI